MKTVLLSLTSLFLVGCASVKTEIIIEASPAEVWSVLIDTNAYPKWNPVMVEVDGRHEVGKKLNYQVVVPGEKPAKIKAKVMAIEKEKLLRQKGGIWGLLTFDHRYKLEKVAQGTKVTQNEDYSGIGTLFWDHNKMVGTYQNSNEALRKRVLELKGR